MAGKNFGRVNVSITASTGGLTAGLGRASKQLGGFAGQAQGIGGRLQAMAAGFVGAGRSATIAAIGVRALGVAIKSLLGPLLIVTSLVSIFAAFGRTSRELDEAGKTARRLGMSMTSFQNMGQVAEEAGVSMQQMGTLLTFMTRNLGNLANGSASAQKAFGRLGLTMADLQGLSPEQQFALISQRIMALPTAAERTAAAMAIFGRQGASAMGLIADASSGAIAEVAKLREQLGLNLTDAQVKGIEMMNDSVARMSLVFQGFLNQLVAGLAPAITTVANLFVKFFAEGTSGFNMASTLANALGQAIRGVAGAVTFLYGAFQVLSSFLGVFITGALVAFSAVTEAIGNMLSAMADAAEALPGMDVGLSSGLRSAADSVSGLSTAAGDEAELWGQAAADNFADGVRNMSDPFAAFDAEFASVTAKMQQAGAAAGVAAGETAGSAIGPAIAASTQALKAIVVGTGEGEAFRNSIMRGADPRLEGSKDQARTADAAEQSAESLEEIEASLAGLGGGIGLATISV
jgi:hypothetical protein